MVLLALVDGHAARAQHDDEQQPADDGHGLEEVVPARREGGDDMLLY